MRVNEDGGTAELPTINLQADPYAAAVVNEIIIGTLDSPTAGLAIIKRGMSQVSIDRAKVVVVCKPALKPRASAELAAIVFELRCDSRITDIN